MALTIEEIVAYAKREEDLRAAQNVAYDLINDLDDTLSLPNAGDNSDALSNKRRRVSAIYDEIREQRLTIRRLLFSKA